MNQRKNSDEKFIKIVEVPFKQSVDTLDTYLEKCYKLYNLGYDLILIPDEAITIPKYSVDYLSYEASKIGVRVMTMLTARDCSKYMMQSRIISLSASGVKSILCVTGEKYRFSYQVDNNNTQNNIFNLSSKEIIEVASNLRLGISIKDGGGFTGLCNISVDLTIFAGTLVDKPSLSETISPGNTDIQQKSRLGAEYFISQPIFLISDFYNFLEYQPKSFDVIPYIKLSTFKGRNQEFINGICMSKANGSLKGVCVSADNGKIDGVLELIEELNKI